MGGNFSSNLSCLTGCGIGSAAAATVVALPPDCLTPAEKLDHMWSKEHSWTAYPSIGGGGPVSLQPVSPGKASFFFLQLYSVVKYCPHHLISCKIMQSGIVCSVVIAIY